MSLVKSLEKSTTTDANDKPKYDIRITECGQVGEIVSKRDDVTNEVEVEVEPQEEEEEEEEIDESQLSHMSEKQKRLFKLRMKINKGKKMNRMAAGEEKKRLEDPYFEAKLRTAARKEKKEAVNFRHLPPLLY